MTSDERTALAGELQAAVRVARGAVLEDAGRARLWLRLFCRAMGASWPASRLRAPEGLHDDRADAYAVAGSAWRAAVQESSVVEAEDPLIEYERSGW